MVATEKLQGRYLIEALVASGGMGRIFSAIDERLGRKVAIKMLRDHLATDPRFVERFRREARAAAALSHPNVAGIFDYGEDTGRHFIVMEYVEGRDLSRVLREEGPLSPERAARLGSQMTAALAHAHAGGLVHRDVKPANVIVSDDDHVKVTDFGIARAAGDSTLTATGSVLGTAHYLSPEQAEGAAVGPPSDVYSAGIVLYEILTGTLPFTGDTPISVAMRHVSEDVPPPSALNAEVPRELDEVVARATEKDAGRRIDARDMAAVLVSFGRDTAEEAAAIAPAATQVLPDGPRPDEGRVTLPIERWDPEVLGRRVLVTLGVLAAIALCLLIWRLAVGTGDEVRSRPREARGQAATETPTPVLEPVEFFIPQTIVGMKEKDAKRLLEDQNIVVEIVPIFDEDIVEDFDIGTVIDSDPDPGSQAFPGETVTLFVSAADEDRDRGKGHGKDKHDEEEDD